MEISVRELKDHLSEYLRRTQAGEEITIASRGHPVGRLVPPRAVAGSPDEVVLARLLAMPGVRGGNGKKVRGSGQPVPVATGTAQEIIDWVRGG